jgi:hypothetical protein
MSDVVQEGKSPLLTFVGMSYIFLDDPVSNRYIGSLPGGKAAGELS